MKITLAIFGKPKDKYFLEKIEDYKKKISKFQKIEIEYLNFHEKISNKTELVKKVLEKYKGADIYLLDEDGSEFNTNTFAKRYERDLNSGVQNVVFVVGPSEGFGDISNFKNIISLSKLTMQHDIAFLVLIEQIYRAVSIKNNLPYHKI